MKYFSFLALAGLVIGSLAQAVVIPGWERPISGAELNYIVPTKPVHLPRADYLTLNQQDGAEEPTSFTLSEDTGIRCITTPCPSHTETQFTINEIVPGLHGDSVRYEATQVLTNIPPNVRIAPRHLTVTESSMELVAPGGGGFTRRTVWQVQVKGFSVPTQYYYGYAEALASIAQGE